MSGREGRGIGVIEKDDGQERWRKTRERSGGERQRLVERGRRRIGAREQDEEDEGYERERKTRDRSDGGRRRIGSREEDEEYER